MGARVSRDLANKSLQGMTASIADRPAINRAVAKFTRQVVEEASKRRRIVLLNVAMPEDAAFWECLHNIPERFEVVSEKESHQKGEYLIRVIFNELGEDLPPTKTQEAFLDQYVRNIDCEE